MEQLIGSTDFDGYLSDVPTQISHGGSDVSQDLLASTKALKGVLEQTFKDKYSALKRHYELRIRNLAASIQNTVTNLFADEVVAELKSDALSSQFILPHLTELIQNQLESEREIYIHEMIAKASELEVHALKSDEVKTALEIKVSRLETVASRGMRAELALEPLKQKLTGLEQEFVAYSTQTESELVKLQSRNHSLESTNTELSEQLSRAIAENANLKREYISACDESEKLEKSYEQAITDLTIRETVERRDREDIIGLKSDLQQTRQERDRLEKEVHSLANNLERTSEELDRFRGVVNEKIANEAQFNKKMAMLMSQVESMINTEADESNAAIAAAHDNLKATR